MAEDGIYMGFRCEYFCVPILRTELWLTGVGINDDEGRILGWDSNFDYKNEYLIWGKQLCKSPKIFPLDGIFAVVQNRLKICEVCQWFVYFVNQIHNFFDDEGS